MALTQYGRSTLEVGVRTPLTSGLEPQSEFPTLDIKHSAGVLGVYYHGKTPCDTLTSATSPTLGFTPAHITLQGKVVYQDVKQGDQDKGAYGVRVICLFHPKDLTGGGSACPVSMSTTFAHPVAGWVEGTHWSKVDVNGNFQFDFYAPGLGTWSPYWDVVLLVTNWNDAALLTQEEGGGIYTILGTGYPGSLTDCPPILTTFDQQHYWCNACANINTLAFSGIEIRLDKADGGVLRNLEFSQEFDNIRFGVKPTRVPTIMSTKATLGGNTGTWNGTQIRILRDGGQSCYLCDHEWGHRLDSYLGTINNHEYTEDFAEFHQFCVRNWATKVYGEDLIQWRDNQEENWSSVDLASTSNVRWGATDGYSYNPIAGFAGFLWHLYDNYPVSSYKAPAYGTANNDDLSEASVLINLLKSVTSWQSASTRSGFLDAMKQAVSPLWPIPSQEATAIQTLWNCMEATDPALHTAPTFPPMLPAQVESFSGHEDAGNLDFSWTFQNYGSTASYQNPPDGVRIWRTNPPYTEQIADVPFPTTSTTVTDTWGSYAQYSIRAYNSTGASWNPPPPVSFKPANGSNSRENLASVQISAVPSPVRDRLEATIKGVAGSAIAVTLLDINQKAVKTSEASILDGQGLQDIQFDCSSLPAGAYYLSVSCSTSATVQKVVIVH
jgi:hypothetical protein